MTIKKLKVVTVVGTRPEIIRLSRVMAKMDEHCEHILVHTGQNYDYELNQSVVGKMDCFTAFAKTGWRSQRRGVVSARSVATWQSTGHASLRGA